MLADLATPMAVRVAATYSVADHIAAGRTTAAAIAEAENLHAESLDSVLRHLVTVGLLERDGDSYALSGDGEFLRSDHPSGMQGLLDMESAIGRADLSFIDLAHVVRTGEPAYPLRYGVSFWEDLAANKSLAVSFDRSMGINVTRDAPRIAQCYDWSQVGHLVDVGGGNGSLLSAILAAHPTLRGTVFDLPDTVSRAEALLAERGLADRADVRAGSFFEEIPSGAGGYVLSSILHDWDDNSAVAILKRCVEAAGDTGKVFIIEETTPDGESPSTEMDLRMLVYYVGRERSLAENIALARNAGLSLIQVHYATPTRVVIELRANGSESG
jgi:O-methyltransferase.